MRIIILFLFYISIISCNVLKETSDNTGIIRLNTNDWNYIHRYIVEYTILHPPKLDVNPKEFFHEEIPEFYILNNLNEANIENLDLYIEFFKNRNNTTLKSQNGSYNQLIIFNKFKPILIKSKAEYIRLNRANTILFSIGRLEKSDDEYFLPIVYWKKYSEINDHYAMVRIFEFEICPNGLIIFKNCYDPLGPFGDNNEYLFDTISLN